ncbi:MAG TPA: hypothetical protein VG755_39475 [Nannocystaceae bacterium]|nr:hypothetical protein [Nannocystaceae bacterium]
MTEADWLHRLDAAGWLAAAETELDAGARRVAERRAAITHARRAAGMALNAVLVAWTRSDPTLDPTAPWGRSYVDHLRMLADGERGPLDADAPALAEAVLATPLLAPALVSLGRRHADVSATLAHARTLVDACAAAIARL